MQLKSCQQLELKMSTLASVEKSFSLSINEARNQEKVGAITIILDVFEPTLECRKLWDSKYLVSPDEWMSLYVCVSYPHFQLGGSF